MKRTFILSVAALALALLLPVAAVAQTAVVETASGTVVSINGTTLVLNTPTGHQTYMLSAPQTLAVGAPVSIKFTRTGDHMMVSSLTPATPAPAPAPAAAPAATGAINNNRDDKVVADGEDDNVTGLDRDAARDGTDPGQAAVVPATTLNNNKDDRVVLDGEDDNVTGLDRDAARDGVDAGQSGNAAGGSLPATASPLALLALLGSAAVAGATALRMKR